jgi:hypothetical protein
MVFIDDQIRILWNWKDPIKEEKKNGDLFWRVKGNGSKYGCGYVYGWSSEIFLKKKQR